ncbi:TIGR01620 family protein [Halomonas sp. ZH2S]|uniref:TIGR01620 family protein n=1 Tax=Vreelandella zhuhanensis TaxID=2684210 RepID=A0A7X3KSJ2_9GAMM|nr:TIGR01620 family protein [Halomonas zhuhanensis]MWJ29416.1 TIGR01620 family protein [Halomonas zhuhanensis]
MNQPSPDHPRPRRHFALDDDPAKAPPTDTTSGLRGHQQFGQEVAHRQWQEDPGAEEQALPAASLGAPRKRRWGLLTALVGGLGLGSAELASGMLDALGRADWLTLAWQAFGIILIGLGGLSLGRELFRLKRLRRHERLRRQLTQLPETSPAQAHAMAEQLRRQFKLSSDDPHWQAFSQACQPHHDGADIQILLAHHLLAPRDRQAQRLISRMSGETAVMVAISPLTLVDMGLVAWRNLAMVDRLCRLYGLELGYASRLRLFKNVLHNMAFAGASELVTDAGMDMLSLDLAGRLSSRAGQGLASGLLSARLGLRAQRLCRPLPFDSESRPKLADLRRDLWHQLKRLETPPSQERSQGSS